MKKLLLVLVIVFALGGGYYVMNRQAAEAPLETAMPVPEGATKEFTIEGSPFEFSVKEIQVKKGDTVKVTFVNKEGMHDWVVDEFNARTKQTQVGESDIVTFVADTAGTFEYYCSVGTHRQMGMVGKLVVE